MAVERLAQNLSRDMLRRYVKDREKLRMEPSESGQKKVLFVHELCECSHKRDEKEGP